MAGLRLTLALVGFAIVAAKLPAEPFYVIAVVGAVLMQREPEPETRIPLLSVSFAECKPRRTRSSGSFREQPGT